MLQSRYVPFRPTFLRSFALSLLIVGLGVSPAEAVGPRSFVLDSIEDLKGGDLAGVAVDSSGAVRAGFALGSTTIGDATNVWSSAVLADGTVLLGTGNEGNVFAARGGAVSLAATTGQMAVSAIAAAWNGDALLGTFPDGKLYRVAKGAAAGAQATVFATFEGAEAVWALAYDAKAKVAYAATGPEGKVFRVDAAGKADVYFDSDEPHIVSLALADDGALYAGSNGKGILFRISAPGRATVVHDFDADDVKAIAVAPSAKGGAVYAIANTYSDPSLPQKKPKQAAAVSQTSRPTKGGKGQLARWGKDGVFEKLIDDDKTHFTTLALDDAGAPYVGTGVDGMVYTVDDNHVVSLVADTAARQVGAMVFAGARRFVATSDPALYQEVRGQGGADAVWTSKVLDAGLRATFGRIGWRAEGALELSTRTGNTDTPNASWSAWSNDLAAPSDIASPPARFIQVRARFRRDPKAILREVTVAFVTDNARAVVTSIDATPKGQTHSNKMGIVASGGEAPKPTSTIHLSWKVDNLDQDELRYRVAYRAEGQTRWNEMLDPTTKLTRTEYDWDTTTLPEGLYRVRVEASDETSNPPDRVTKHALESRVVLVDNTPPTIRNLRIAGRRLTGEIIDGLGPIARVEVALAGTDDFRPLFPADLVLDEATEALDADISALVPPGTALVAVRAYDAAGNAVTANAEAR